MRRLPGWKIRRELARPFRQIAALPERIFSRLFGSLYYDILLSGRVRNFEGVLPAADKVAVYLIFPTTGLADSHVTAIRYLSSGGYAPLVVSNLPLSGADRQRLRDICWRWVERPNFGYDFGGYRDGVLTATSDVPDLKRLVLVNDSCWFPLPGSADCLAQAETMDRDFVGAASHYGHPRIGADQYLEIAWNYCTAHRHFHYASFALKISERVLRDGAFVRFWRRFLLSNTKRLTVTRGETGLTIFILSRGYSHGTTHDTTQLDHVLAGLASRELETVA